MGKTSKPLSFLIHPSLLDGSEAEKLREQGHTVDHGDRVHTLTSYDLILGPNCCWCTKEHLPYILKIMIAKARKVKYAQKDTKDS